MLGVEILMVGASLRQGMEGERVELGEAPSERTHTFAWSGELRRIGREGGREGERKREKERRERERERKREREARTLILHTCMPLITNMLCAHRTMIPIRIMHP